MALPLIDKQDNFEVIRDQIAGILVAEVNNQKQLATNAGKDPLEWDLHVYAERSNPWEKWLNYQPGGSKSPIVNVWFETSNFSEKASNISERQKSTSAFNIDCYGFATSKDNPGGGHIAGDQASAEEAQRAVRLVRNILMASENTYLQLRGLVWQRWPQSIKTFQQQIDAQQVQQVVGARLVLQVIFNEFAPQYQPETLEHVAIDVKRAEDGRIVLEADYDYTT